MLILKLIRWLFGKPGPRPSMISRHIVETTGQWGPW